MPHAGEPALGEGAPVRKWGTWALAAPAQPADASSSEPPPPSSCSRVPSRQMLSSCSCSRAS
eukprot:7901059-Lingulodinium_polyedra.AAC.1